MASVALLGEAFLVEPVRVVARTLVLVERLVELLPELVFLLLLRGFGVGAVGAAGIGRIGFGTGFGTGFGSGLGTGLFRVRGLRVAGI